MPDKTIDAQRLRAVPGGSLAGVAIRLAWGAGLRRGEIYDLRWTQIDLDGARLTLPDRTMALDADAVAALRAWREATAGSAYVAVSPRTGTRPTSAALSTAVRRALERSGVPGVGLDDLRADFERRTREAPDGARQEERLWELLQRNREGALAVALWLALQANLTNREIIALTWDDVDLERGTVRVGGAERYLLKEIIAILSREKAARADGDDPHVVLSPGTRAPMGEKNLSRRLRGILARAGLSDYYIDRARESDKREQELSRVRRFAESNGSVTARDAETTLGLSRRVARDRLRALADGGELVRVGRAYVPRALYLSEEQRPDAVLRLVDAAGYTTVAAVASALRLPREMARTLLYNMEADGALDSGGKHRKFTRGAKMLPRMVNNVPKTVKEAP